MCKMFFPQSSSQQVQWLFGIPTGGATGECISRVGPYRVYSMYSTNLGGMNTGVKRLKKGFRAMNGAVEN